eukprot:tig00001409_g8628.t1
MDSLLHVYEKGVTRVGLSGSRRFLSVSIAFYGRMFSIAGLPAFDPDGTLEERARAAIHKYVDALEKNHLELGDVNTGDLVKLRSLAREGEYGVEHPELREEETIVYDAIFHTIDSARKLMQYPSAAAFRHEFPDPETNNDFYMMSKDLEEIYEALVHETKLEGHTAAASFATIRAFLITIFCTNTVICFVLAVFFFRPKIKAVEKEKEDMLRLFFDIPRNLVHGLMGKGREGRGAEDDDDEDFDDDDSLFGEEAQTHGKAAAAAAAGGKAAALAKEEEEELLKLKGGDGVGVGPGAGLGREEAIKARKLHRIFVKGRSSLTLMNIRYVAAFVALFAIFFAWFVTAYVGAGTCEHFTDERDAGGLRKSLARYVAYEAQELIVARSGVFGAQHANGASGRAGPPTRTRKRSERNIRLLMNPPRIS